MNIQDGGVTTVCDAPNARGGSWSAAGFILFTPTISSPIMKVAATGGNPVAVSSVKSGLTTYRWPQALPDGKHFLYFAATHAKAGAGDETGMYVGSTDGRESVLLLHLPVSGLFADGKFLFLRGTTLMEQAFDASHLRLSGEPLAVASGVGYDLGVWRGTFSVADNGVLVYSGGDPSSHFLQWFGSNGQPEKNMTETGRYADSALSSTGTRLAGVNDPQGDLWVTDLNGAGRVRLAERNASDPVWSPDPRLRNWVIVALSPKRPLAGKMVYQRPRLWWLEMSARTSALASSDIANSSLAFSRPKRAMSSLAPLRRPVLIWPPLRPEAPQPTCSASSSSVL